MRLGTPALTTRGFGPADFDRVAELITDVLAATQPVAGEGGAASKAKYVLPADRISSTRAAAAELLDANPLYPGLVL